MILWILKMVIVPSGARQDSKDWSEYEKAKKYMINHYVLSPPEYKTCLNIIADYIGV